MVRQNEESLHKNSMQIHFLHSYFHFSSSCALLHVSLYLSRAKSRLECSKYCGLRIFLCVFSSFVFTCPRVASQMFANVSTVSVCLTIYFILSSLLPEFFFAFFMNENFFIFMNAIESFFNWKKFFSRSLFSSLLHLFLAHKWESTWNISSPLSSCVVSCLLYAKWTFPIFSLNDFIKYLLSFIAYLYAFYEWSKFDQLMQDEIYLKPSFYLN